MTELTREIRIAIIQAKLAQNAQYVYSAQIDARVADDVKDDRMRQAAVEALKGFEQRKDTLEEMLAEVQGEPEEGEGG